MDPAIDPPPFDDARFWRKLARLPCQAGRRLLEFALLLYVLYRDPQVPAWAKAVIAGTLAYFICPLDLLPDLLPGVGYTDDLAAMLALVNALALHITDAHRQQAKALAARRLDRTQALAPAAAAEAAVAEESATKPAAMEPAGGGAHET